MTNELLSDGETVIVKCSDCGLNFANTLRHIDCPARIQEKKMVQDNWQHRSDNMLCGTCIWWVEKKSRSGNATAGAKIGRCRKKAPTMNGWPVLFSTDWCGKHKLDENKRK